MKRLIKKLLININKLNQKQWLFFSIITTTIGIWFPLIISFYGNYLGLTIIGENGETIFTTVGLILTLLTVAWSLISTIAQRYSEYNTHNLGISVDNFNDTETIYSTLNNSSTSIIESGVVEKIKFIEKFHTDNSLRVNYPIKKPCETIQNISNEMVKVLSKLLTSKNHNIKERDIVLNIYYNFPIEKNFSWHLANSSRQQKGLSISQLQQKDSSFYEAIHSTKNYVFYNNKIKAYKTHHYIIDQEDILDKNLPKGSIACFYYDIERNEKKYVEFVITIATYGKMLSKFDNSDEIENIAYNLKNNIFPEYEMLIKSALLDLYITHINPTK